MVQWGVELVGGSAGGLILNSRWPRCGANCTRNGATHVARGPMSRRFLAAPLSCAFQRRATNEPSKKREKQTR